MIDALQQVQKKTIEAKLARINTKRDRINEKEEGIADKKNAVVGISESIERRATSLTRWFIVVGLLAGVVSVGLGWFIANLITKPLGEIIRVLETSATGDLSQRGGRQR